MSCNTCFKPSDHKSLISARCGLVRRYTALFSTLALKVIPRENEHFRNYRARDKDKGQRGKTDHTSEARADKEWTGRERKSGNRKKIGWFTSCDS